MLVGWNFNKDCAIIYVQQNISDVRVYIVICPNSTHWCLYEHMIKVYVFDGCNVFICKPTNYILKGSTAFMIYASCVVVYWTLVYK